MNDMRLKKVMFVMALIGTSFAAFTAVRAEDAAAQTEIIESLDEVVVSESEVPEEIDETFVTESEISEVIETSEEALEEDEEIIETEAVESEPDETEETEMTEEPEVEYDVPSSVINGWYVPSFNYNDDGTITYFLSDGTPFYNVEMNELELPQYAWAYTGLRGYVDYQYGSVNYLTDEEMSSFETAADSILSGQGA